ncbi:MAG TPA: Crp/Fnr family transcriptional regulator [Candidatus Onthovicinus excrementipullorum]|nr:Crp/Fnr family transcriptional regulator [Candidatus Onthovicinus excrementipullorum]
MEELTIFTDISPESRSAMRTCFRSRELRYDAGEIITTYTNRPQKIGVLLSGHARLYYCDTEGNQSVIEDLFPNSVFGELFLLPDEMQEYYVSACEPCRVLFIDYEHIVKRCPNACAHHSQLVSNLFQLTARKARRQANRINILTQPTARMKLLAYFNLLSASSEGGQMTVPIPYSALAEYLCLDRSAMMRELKKMADAGIIQRDRRKIHLLTGGGE